MKFKAVLKPERVRRFTEVLTSLRQIGQAAAIKLTTNTDVTRASRPPMQHARAYVPTLAPLCVRVCTRALPRSIAPQLTMHLKDTDDSISRHVGSTTLGVLSCLHARTCVHMHLRMYTDLHVLTRARAPNHA